MTSDDSYGVIELPFPVHFYGLPYTEITASSNGLIGMGQVVSAADYSNDPVPSTINPNNFIAPMWDDWTLSTWSSGIPGAIYTKTVGVEPSRKFAVIFHDMVKYGSDTDYYTWEVVFEEANMTPMARSFYADNKRVKNDLIKREFKLILKYPDFKSGLSALTGKVD